ncbi:dTDP-3-amino-3,4,6-trideoxy-alpha-D-glucopyranose [Pseudobythopirellula maris]|uniref:dTDP-3-amino-3,4, 6-trideoxy-alpha-D-glucopyranose n=1 Tax=Pseudobythopirellula maris TaxID=2527991 RepID=A0A5C5ZUQ9_9BACT|nr:class I SAM-dependent methyltransferase [Pseudobythopirellula maris]TWT90956.1 dTDP-3-amino-3,4,6-trideoxy-alpha-D-glucopyranose [Pseudobythopirellula maris]
MPDKLEGSLYDYPKYYDLVFGSDWKAEFDFLEECFAKHARGRVKRLFEPACGTGRLLMRFGRAGYEVAGNDLNAKAIDFCNARLRRHQLAESAEVGDMCDFRLKRKACAMFNTINSFRHLGTEAQAVAHLGCVAAGLRRGGIYVLGLHLTPTAGPPESDEESWAARRGQLSVLSRMWSIDLDRRRRRETVGMSFDVYTPTSTRQLLSTIDFRTYTARQMADLIAKVPALEAVATYDFAYDIDKPVSVDPETEDVVFILKKQ